MTLFNYAKHKFVRGVNLSLEKLALTQILHMQIHNKQKLNLTLTQTLTILLNRQLVICDKLTFDELSLFTEFRWY